MVFGFNIVQDATVENVSAKKSREIGTGLRFGGKLLFSC
jgi:hypothetical protein